MATSSRQLAEISLQSAVKLKNGAGVGQIYTNLGDLINLVVRNLFVLAGVIFLFLLILGGIGIIAGGSTKSVEEGQKKITTAIIGFLIMFSAYWIVKIVEILTGIPIL